MQRQPGASHIGQPPDQPLALQQFQRQPDCGGGQRQAHAVHPGILAVPDRIGADGQQHSCCQGGTLSQAKASCQPAGQSDCQHPKPGRQKTQRKFAVSAERQPSLGQVIAGQGVGLAQFDCRCGQVGIGALDKKIAERFIAAQLLEIEQGQTQCEGRQQDGQGGQPAACHAPLRRCCRPATTAATSSTPALAAPTASPKRTLSGR